jgi:hypothetical protein
MRFRSVTSRVSLVVAAAACSSSSSSTPDDSVLLAPPAEGQGVQISMVSTIAPGQEIERCKFYQVPPGGMNINRATVRYAAGSHHVLVYRTSYLEIPHTTLAGTEITPNAEGVFDCTNGAAGDWDVDGVVAGAQSFGGKDAAQFPPGVAAKLPGGTVLIINTHYLNVSDKPLQAEARINLQTIADAAVITEGGFLFFYNPFIFVRPQSTGAARMSCPIVQDIKLVSGQSHMHRRGVAYEALLVDSSAAASSLYESDDWENVPVKEWLPTGMDLSAGQAIDYTCHYSNTEDRVVTQGLTTKDEMCMFLGAYYPRNRELEACPTLVPGKGATYIGSGASDGSTTLACLGQAFSAPHASSNEKLFGCVVDSCPAAAKALTGYLNCRIGGGREGASCHEACAGGPEACGTCLTAACEADKTGLAGTACN